jgi:hypothetical protein
VNTSPKLLAACGAAWLSLAALAGDRYDIYAEVELSADLGHLSADQQPFIGGYGDKPLGAQCYPAHITGQKVEAWDSGAVALLEECGRIGKELQGDLDRLAAADIVVDIVLRQGREVLGL